MRGFNIVQVIALADLADAVTAHQDVLLGFMGDEDDEQVVAALAAVGRAYLRASGLAATEGDSGESGTVATALEDVVERYRKTPIPSELRWAVFRRDGFTCKRCGRQEDLHADHIEPESKGGPTTMANLQTLCGDCNRKKGNRV